uniref:TF-B3 domain-containing protein n=1 Tax=Oryza brachyantha TaxID=4533 RepID=J3MG15_ORYBR
MALSAGVRRSKYAAPLLSPACLRRLCVPGEFVAALGPGDAGEAAAVVLVVGPLGKVWRVELAWATSEGWTVVLRLERRGVASLRAFDPCCCLARFCTPHTGMKTKDRPRFIKLLQQEDLEKMKIPEKFVQQHLTETCTNSHQNAIILSPLGKFCRVEVEREQPDMLLRDGWAAFLAAHDLSEGNILLFRYEGNMVFTVEVFLENGCLKEYTTATLYLTDGSKGRSVAPQQCVTKAEVSPVKRKRTQRSGGACLEESSRKSRASPISVKKVESHMKHLSIVPQNSFTKEMTSYSVHSLLAVKGTFCSQIGLLEASTITLKISMKNKGSWRVAFKTANTYGYINGPGWRKFCLEKKHEFSHSLDENNLGILTILLHSNLQIPWDTAWQREQCKSWLLPGSCHLYNDSINVFKWWVHQNSIVYGQKRPNDEPLGESEMRLKIITIIERVLVRVCVTNVSQVAISVLGNGWCVSSCAGDLKSISVNGGGIVTRLGEELRSGRSRMSGDDIEYDLAHGGATPCGMES